MADQQRLADAFFKPGLISRPVRVAGMMLSLYEASSASGNHQQRMKQHSICNFLVRSHLRRQPLPWYQKKCQ
jgi:hypothetical protein